MPRTQRQLNSTQLNSTSLNSTQLNLALVSQVLHLFSGGGWLGPGRNRRASLTINGPQSSIFLPILRDRLSRSLDQSSICIPILREPTVNHPYQYLQSFKSIILQPLTVACRRRASVASTVDRRARGCATVYVVHSRVSVSCSCIVYILFLTSDPDVRSGAA